MDKIKNLSPTSLAKIIAIIQSKDPNNKTTNRAISGNIRVLNPDNKEDGFKYTSHKHAEKVKALLENNIHLYEEAQNINMDKLDLGIIFNERTKI